MGLKVGSKIPLFTLPDGEGNPFSIQELIGKKSFVIYFYPKNNTPGCTKEACDFRDSYEDFVALGAEVVGISADSAKVTASRASCSSPTAARSAMCRRRAKFTLAPDRIPATLAPGWGWS